MLIYSMSVSVDGFIADRDGAFAFTVPSEEQSRFHLAQTGELGGAGLAAAAIELGLVDELRMFRNPVPRRWRHAVFAAGHRRRPA